MARGGVRGRLPFRSTGQTNWYGRPAACPRCSTVLLMGKRVVRMNLFMEERAERLRQEFPPPKYRVELYANETEIRVVNEMTHAAVELGEHDFELAPEGAEEIGHIRRSIG